MSRFVRASKYRHVFGQTGKKEYGYENLKITNSAWDTNVVSASASYVSVNWNAAGGGAFAILPLPSPFSTSSQIPSKLPDSLPLCRSHTAPVLDTDWNPHNDSVVASAGEDGNVMIWDVRTQRDMFEGWGAEGWVPKDLEPVLRIGVSPRKIGQVLWNPTVENLLASATGEHLVKFWDLNAGVESPRTVLTGHTDTIQSIAFNASGTLLVTSCRDRKLRMYDPRAGAAPVREGDGHPGVKASRVVWMGDLDRIASTGFSKMSDRQLSIWDANTLANVKTQIIDQTAGVVMPFWSDNNILFLAGKGDGNIRFYEYENDALHQLSEHKSSDPQRGMCFLPRRALSVGDCEIARAFKLHGTGIEPIAFIVPRKADSFQSDIFPPAPSAEPSMSASEYFSGKEMKKKLVDLQTGATSATASAPASFAPSPAQTSTPTAAAPAPAPAPAPASVSKSYSAPTPSAPASAPAPAPEPMHVSEPAYSAPTPAPVPAASDNSSAELQSLRAENAKLTEELREARNLIRDLELKAERSAANARKAAAMLSEFQ